MYSMSRAQLNEKYIDKWQWSEFHLIKSLSDNLKDLFTKTIQTRNVRQTPKFCFPMDSNTWTDQCWLTSKNLYSSALCGYWILFRGLADRDEWWERVKRNLCCQHALTMMMMTFKTITMKHLKANKYLPVFEYLYQIYELMEQNYYLGQRASVMWTLDDAILNVLKEKRKNNMIYLMTLLHFSNS